MSETLEKTYMWDSVVRVLHWALVLSFSFTWGMGKFGPDIMTLHFYGGYTTATIALLRIMWGFYGWRTAKFSHFVKGPKAIVAYARKLPSEKPSYTFGHNPVGALFVVGVLLVILMQVGSGLISDPEDFVNVGPLAHLVSYEMTQEALELHEPLSTLLLLMVIAHISAVMYYRLRKGENLVKPMITGYVDLPNDTPKD